MSEKTETEQLFDDITAETDEQPEEITEETPEELAEDEELLTEEQLEVARAIAEYETEIEQLDAKLAAFEAESVLDKKREALRKFNYNDSQIERYINHLQGTTDEEIKESAFSLMMEIPPNDGYADPSAFNWAREKGTTDRGEQLKQIGRDAFERVKHKVFPGGRA